MFRFEFSVTSLPGWSFSGRLSYEVVFHERSRGRSAPPFFRLSDPSTIMWMVDWDHEGTDFLFPAVLLIGRPVEGEMFPPPKGHCSPSLLFKLRAGPGVPEL